MSIAELARKVRERRIIIGSIVYRREDPWLYLGSVR